jgi:serine/threonine protein phosphatase 1
LAGPHLTFAIGDVHGELGLLVRAFAMIEARAGDAPFRIVMLGDYVDRGPDSAGVIGLLRDRAKGYDLVCLRGNHEQMMLDALAGGSTDSWFRNGGKETLASYHGEVPLEDLAWLRALPVHVCDEHRIYVHAGLRPCVSLAQQEDKLCLWIRDPFLRASAEDLPAHVVHGHTPEWDGKPEAALPELLPHRTNLDTAAYETGILTVGLFETGRPGGPLEVMTVGKGEPPHDLLTTSGRLARRSCSLR